MSATPTRPTHLGIVLLTSPTGTSFDGEVDAIVARVAAAGMTPVKDGTTFRVQGAAGTATITPEPAPLTYNAACAPMIAAHPDPGAIVELYKAHTGLVGVQLAATSEDGTAFHHALLRAVAGHPTASVVVLPGESRFATAQEFVAAAPEPAPAAPTPEPTPSGEPVLTAVVLLGQPPASMGDVLDAIQPGLGAQLPPSPVQSRMNARFNGQEFAIGGTEGPVTDERLTSDLGVSPVAALVGPVVQQHRGTITIGLVPGPDFADGGWRDGLDTFANVVATVLNRDDAGAVWLPEQRCLTTDVLFQGDVERRPALVWARVHAGVLDPQQGTAFAFTQGLAALGGREVQLVVQAEPARLFEDLRQTVAAWLDAGRLPAEGEVMALPGGSFRLVAGTSVVGLGDVLDLRAG